MDIKQKIEDLAGKLSKDGDLKARFQKDPVKAVETLLGVDLPDETVQKLVEGVKAKLTADQAAGVVDKLKDLF